MKKRIKTALPLIIFYGILFWLFFKYMDLKTAIPLTIFYSVILLLFIIYQDRFTIQAKIIALYKTKIGLKFMDRFPRLAPRFFKVLGFVGMILGFGGMVFIFIFLIKATLNFLITPGAIPPLSPVLPGVKIPGVPTLSFWHWIISILVVATVHEFSHGIFARLHKIPIKSSGFAIFGPILGAFVEPNDKKLTKAKKYKQLSVFAAGPFANMIFAVLFLLIFNFFTNPMVPDFFEPNGIIIDTLIDNQPMQATGIEAPFTITMVNGMETKNFTSFIGVLSMIKPNDKIMLNTDKGDYEVIAAENPDNSSLGFLGVKDFNIKFSIKNKYLKHEKLLFVLMWINILLFWLFLINFGVGLFNLLPLGPLDGGRMLFVASLWLFKSEKKASKLLGIISIICLILIFINLWPWIMKLLTYLGNAIMLLA